MSENLVKKDNMVIWPIAYAIMLFPIVIFFAKPFVYAGIKKIQRVGDKKVESLTELIDRTKELQDGSIIMDTAAIYKDMDRTLQNAKLDWQDISDKEAGFRAKFPQGIIEKDTANNFNETRSSIAFLYTVDLKDQIDPNSGYWIASYKIDEGSLMEEMFDRTEKILTKGSLTELLSKKDAQAKGYIARDLKIKINSFEIMHVRIAYYRSNIYTIRVLAPIGNADNNAVAYFFNSFQPL